MLPSDIELIEHARKAAEVAYAPYSNFPVGAALLLDDGRVITGCNVENASFGLTICAERNAVVQAVATGDGTAPIIRAVAIIGLRAEPCYPCGACRQVLHEFHCERVIVSQDQQPHSVAFAELLPYAFGPEAL